MTHISRLCATLGESGPVNADMANASFFGKSTTVLAARQIQLGIRVSF